MLLILLSLWFTYLIKTLKEYDVILDFCFNLQVVKDLTMQILMQTVQQGKNSIAMPPIGTGRRFGYRRSVVADAMLQASQEFVQANPGKIKVCTC